jgi:hypothetical protein
MSADQLPQVPAKAPEVILPEGQQLWVIIRAAVVRIPVGIVDLSINHQHLVQIRAWEVTLAAGAAADL